MKKLELKLEKEIFELAKISAPCIRINLVDSNQVKNNNNCNNLSCSVTESVAELIESDFDRFNVSIVLRIVEPNTEADFNNCFKAINEAKKLHLKAREIMEYKKNNPVYWEALKAKFYCTR